MDALSVAQTYFDAWNRHDAEAVVACFASGGTYCDPTSGGELTGPAIAAYASGLFSAFPDLAFDIVSHQGDGQGHVSAQWLMRGTHTGPLAGSPPTGKTVALPGADFLVIEGEQVRSVRGYFDQKEFLEQLGLKVQIQPPAMGPLSFGDVTHLQTGKTAVPGAFSLTVLTVKSESEAEEVRARSQQIMMEMLEMPGLLSIMGITVGPRMYTISAWTDPESPRQLLREGSHRDAMHRFFGPDFSLGGNTGVWIPHHLNKLWVRCAGCGKMIHLEADTEVCPCGANLPEPVPYW